MVFTEEDANNDGLIKREVGREMAKVAKTQNPDLFGYFEQVANEVGREPADIFGEMCVRALNDEAYANQIMQSEVNMRKLRSDEIRVEDVKYVKQLADELGLNEKDESDDPIERLINNRLETVTTSPMSQIQEKRNQSSQNDEQVMEHMQSLQSEINRLRQKIDDEGEVQQTEQTSSPTNQSESKSVDELFGDDDGSPEEEEVETEEVQQDFTEDSGEKKTVEISDGENSTEAEPEPEPEEELPEEAIDEAMSGLGDSDEDEGMEEGEELEMDIEMPNEEEDGIDDLFTSEDGVEE